MRWVFGREQKEILTDPPANLHPALPVQGLSLALEEDREDAGTHGSRISGSRSAGCAARELAARAAPVERIRSAC